MVVRGDESESPKLTEQDCTIASLKANIATLQAQVDQISTLITLASEKAKQAVSTRNRVSAATALRSKKIYEKRLEQRGATLSQLEEVYSKIEQAADQASMIRITQASTGVLKDLNKETGGIEKAEDVVAQLREETSKVDEVGDVIRSAGQGIAPFDEDAVDEELENMLREAMARDEKQKSDEDEIILDSTPKVPNVIPSKIAPPHGLSSTQDSGQYPSRHSEDHHGTGNETLDAGSPKSTKSEDTSPPQIEQAVT